MLNFKEEFERWLSYENLEKELKGQLLEIKDDEAEIQDRFYQNLTFGTAGLRGKLGAGTNRMNVYTVGRATKGLAKVIEKYGKEAKNAGVAIAHDCRIMSPEFAKMCAQILATFGIKVYIFDSLRPTPELSYTVRYYKCISGINITASHNPKEYNGYKVYWKEGAQIKDDIANQVLDEIDKIDMFEEFEIVDFDEAVKKGTIQIINTEVDEAYYRDVMSISLNDEKVDKDIKIVYTPLNGAGNIAVRTILDRMGYKNIYVVKEQENPDGTFPTVAYPNPEDQRAFEYAQKLGIEVGADILIATDPDSDRLAVQVIDDGEIYGFNGNQIGVLLINYIFESMKANNKLSSKPAIIKSIVTGDMGATIAQSYGAKVYNVLTGFKNIAEVQNKLDETGEYDFVFGYEESIGYNAGNFVRDKDAVSSALLLAEAGGYYKKQGKSLKKVLDELFEKYGYFAEDTVSIVLEGIEGQERIKRIMKEIRNIFPKNIGESEAVKTVDYVTLEERNILTGEITTVDMEKTNAFECRYNDGSWYTLRPSGTEPKIKIYIYTKSDSLEKAKNKVSEIYEEVRKVVDSVE